MNDMRAHLNATVPHSCSASPQNHRRDNKMTGRQFDLPPSERREYFNFNTYLQTHRECDTEFLPVEFKLTERTKASAEISTFQLRARKSDSQREATSQRKPSEATGDNAAL